MLQKLLKQLSENNTLTTKVKNSFSYVGANLLDGIIKASEQDKNISKNVVNELADFKDDYVNTIESQAKLNSWITKQDNTFTTAQLQMNLTLVNTFLKPHAEKNPSLERIIKSSIDSLLYRTDSVFVEGINTSHNESHKEKNATRQILNKIENLLYQQKPGKNQPGELTDLGKAIKLELGEGEFQKATQLLDNMLAENTGYRPMTDADFDKSPIGSYTSTWKDPKKSYVIEKEANKNNLASNDTIYCKEAQIKLINSLVQKELLDDYTPAEISALERYINRQAEVLVSNSKGIKDSKKLFLESQYNSHNTLPGFDFKELVY
ncbi:hypothetical protein [Facilibium subflavum]|uniref:hypothetical protein n=1 Tax=Facilibium subflavum TaxID=2219058 RepID=UPI000E64ECC0|nr:hypothetical protein [Facilibium subflavum]